MGSVDPLSWIGLGTDVLGMGASYAGNQYAADKQYQATQETNAQNYKIWQESQDFSREQADTQWEREKEMFNMENSYNNPVNVVGRLREAGLNPALAMQGSLGSAMSSAASGGSPTIGSTPTAPTMQVPAIGQYYSNIANGIQDASLKASQILKNIADAKKTGVDTSYLENSMEYRIKKDMQDARYQELFTDLYEEFEPQRVAKELVKLDKENRKIDNECNRLIKEGKYLDAQRRLQDLLGDKQVVENNYLSSYYERKRLYVGRFVKAELTEQENNAKAIIMNALSNQTSAKAAYNSSLAALKNAATQDYLAHNPNDVGGLLANVIKGYAGSPEAFGKMIKDEGLLAVIYKMTKGERDKTWQTLAHEIGIPYRSFKRFLREDDPLGGFFDWLHADGEESQKKFGFKLPGHYLIDYIHDRYDDFREDDDE